MNEVGCLLRETLATGELEKQLRGLFQRWHRHFSEFAEFREAVLGRAWEHREQFRGQTAEEFLAWLRRIGVSTAVDKVREERRRANLLDRLAKVFRWVKTPLPEAAVDTADLIEWLLAGLSSKERRLVVLKYYLQMSYDEISRAMGTSRNGVYQLHHRVLEKLRTRMRQQDPD
jgi:RNA polymerase sigma factor (sigma-70 family)